ncbi:uncharacterized protein NH340_JMT04206 [Sarcoptes scabiei]|nr:uncharacterized protein NH340_JMT04206 [Sarcoptes scabiei]
MITHVIFDLDGTLVDTITCTIQSVESILSKRGLQMSEEFKEFIPNINRFDHIRQKINADYNLSLERKEFFQELVKEFSLKNIKLMPGAERLIKHLYDQNIPMAIATGNSKAMIDIIWGEHGEFFQKYINHFVSAFDDPEVKNLKPDPEVFLVAAKRFSEPPESMSNVLIFEDSITGIKGAIASQARSIFVSKLLINSIEHKNLIDKSALAIESLEHFKPEIFGLKPKKKFQ